MLIPLPNLDDRRWADLIEESRSLIPVYAPDWTDYNVSDPGITLVELLAWQTEMDVFQLNQVPEATRRKFLALVGVRPEPPQPARAVLRLALSDHAHALSLSVPAGTEFQGNDPYGVPTRFTTRDSLVVAPGSVARIYSRGPAGLQDLTPRWTRGEAVALFGDDPAPGAAFYLGFTMPLPSIRCSLYFTVADPSGSRAERERLLAERDLEAECQVQLPACPVPEGTTAHEQSSRRPRRHEPLRHHSVQLVWEIWSAGGRWLPLDEGLGEIDDDTRALTLDGTVRVHPRQALLPAGESDLDPSLSYLRCRLAAGAYDAAPQLLDLAFNGVTVEQVSEPEAGERIAAPPTVAGVSRAEHLGAGTGRPEQQVVTAEHPIVAASLQVFSIEGGTWRRWRLRQDFDASTRADAHYLLDPATGTITFGDGEHGRTVPAGAWIMAAYRVTRAEAGNLGAYTIRELPQNRHNVGHVPQLDQLRADLSAITNPLPATGGVPGETLVHAEGRAAGLLLSNERAVTLGDVEELARRAPGCRVARTSAVADLHPAFPCFHAPGLVSVVILPGLPLQRPSPSPGLRQAVHAYLMPRRPVGTRIEVFAPGYRTVLVQATIVATGAELPASVVGRVRDALDRFFHPLYGGPAGTGWPFGRAVHRTEVFQAITQVPGVAHVASLELIANGCGPQCGSVCLGPFELVDSGTHEITVR